MMVLDFNSGAILVFLWDKIRHNSSQLEFRFTGLLSNGSFLLPMGKGRYEKSFVLINGRLAKSQFLILFSISLGNWRETGM